MSYDVGQVLYIISSSTKRVIPVQVSERIVKQTLNGDTTSYIVVVPGKSQGIDLSKIKGNIFTDLSIVRQTMITNATGVIDKMVGEAESLASSSFVIPERPDSDDKESLTDNVVDVNTLALGKKMTGLDNIEVMLEDGTVAKVNVQNA